MKLSRQTQEKLKELGANAVYLFGSRAEQTASDTSDYDVAILLKNPHPITQEFYQQFYEIFADVFDLRDFKTVDIVFLHQAPLELQFDVITNGQVLFEDNSSDRLDYHAITTLKYADFQPLLNQFDYQILNR